MHRNNTQLRLIFEPVHRLIPYFKMKGNCTKHKCNSYLHVILRLSLTTVTAVCPISIKLNVQTAKLFI